VKVEEDSRSYRLPRQSEGGVHRLDMVGIVSSSVKALCLAAVVFAEVSDAFVAPAALGGGLALRQGASSGAVSGLRMAGFGKKDDKAKRGSQAKTKLMGEHPLTLYWSFRSNQFSLDETRKKKIKWVHHAQPANRSHNPPLCD